MGSATPIIERPCVERRLAREIGRHPVTVIAAPAGAGKTTAVAQVVARHEGPARWVTASPGLDDAALLAEAIAGTGASATHGLIVSGRTEPTRLGIALAGDLAAQAAAGAPPLVVLDDAHRLASDACRELLRAATDELGDGPRLVVCTRGAIPLPLGRLRAAGRVAELGTGDLRFTAGEAAVLAGALGAEADPAGTAAAVDGWPALLALALRAGRADAPPVFAYLAEELLDRLDPSVRRTLEDCAVLEVLEHRTAAAVSRSEHAWERIEAAQAAGLPFVAAGGGLRPHDLLRDVLLTSVDRRGGEADLRELHRRAGVALSPRLEAVEHHVAAGDPAAASELLERHARSQMAAGVVLIPERLIALLPDEERRRPLVRLAGAAIDVQRGRADAAVATLEALVDGEEGVAARLLLVDAALALGDFARAEEQLQALPAELAGPPVQVSAHIGRSWVGLFRGRPTAAIEELDAAVEVALASGDEASRSALGQGLSVVQLLIHPNPAAFERKLAALAAADAGPGPFALAGGTVLAAAAAFRVRPELAYERLRAARALALRLGPLGWVDAELDLVELHLAVAGADHARVRAVVDTARERLDTSAVHGQLRAAYALAWARATWDRGDRAAAGPQGLDLIGSDRPEDVFPAARARAALHAMSDRAAGNLDGAERTLRESSALPAGPPLPLALDPAGDLSALLLERDRRAEATALALPWLARLAAANRLGLVTGLGADGWQLLRLAAEEGDATLAGAARAALASAGRLTPVSLEIGGERLTPREAEVLRLLAAGASNRELAEALVVTERTAKTHVANLRRKLGARSRTHAVAIARAGGIV